MTTCLVDHQRTRYRAPEADGTAVIDPPFDRVAAALAENQATVAQYRYDLQGRWLSEVAGQARGELLSAAARWTSTYRDVDRTALETGGWRLEAGGKSRTPSVSRLQSPASGLPPIFLAGHQPQLFHPGVWLKNFSLGAIARQHDAVAVNLLIDTDTMKQNTVAVPGSSAARPEVGYIAMDRPAGAIPFEERKILDHELFSQFGRRVREQIAPLIPDPLIDRYWPLATSRARFTDNLGACLAQSRHQLEGAWGLTTLEVPESAICRCEPFAWLVCHLLAGLPRFRDVYNQVVQEYRKVNRIRSAAHPVPDLASEGSWLEAPFWIWTTDNPFRRKLFVRTVHKHIRLSDRQGLEVSLPLSADGTAHRAVQQLSELAEKGIKIRGRALVTTLWARLVLGDLFVHGIGGAKYDQVTDGVIARFFGLKPPRFMVVSGTLRLPVEHPPTTQQEVRKIDHQLRELTYHPEVYLDQSVSDANSPDSGPAELIAAKRHVIATRPTPANARKRFEEVRRINETLQPWVASQRTDLLAERARIAQALAAESILSSREYVFCLFAENTLREFLFGLLPKNR